MTARNAGRTRERTNVLLEDEPRDLFRALRAHSAVHSAPRGQPQGEREEREEEVSVSLDEMAATQQV
jgi:hypothetical protein